MRYALYYIPEQASSMTLLGASLLGWDIYGAQASSSENILHAFEKVGLKLSQERLASITHQARRYGLHATLKAPFHLAKGCHEEQLVQAVMAFASAQKAFTLPPLCVKRIGNFLALTSQDLLTEQEQQCKQKTYDLAAQCVEHLDDFRRPPSAQELVRRRQKKLTSRQEDYLLRFGYPYVMEDFRFHITLCHLSDDEKYNTSLQSALSQIFSSCLQNNKFALLHICRSDEAGQFSLLQSCPFMAS